jgi:uncharacterized membrane-anchored protein
MNTETQVPVVAPPAAPLAGRPPAWRFWLPMALQLVIITTVPAPKVWAHATGTTVLLRTMPVDPYDALRGRYMRLGYADANADTLAKLPGAKPVLDATVGELVWVELAPGKANQPWKAVKLHASRPGDLPAGHTVIKGRSGGGIVDWELGEYFVPEASGDGIEAAMRQDASKSTWAEARVSADGTAVLEGLWIAGKRY